ncbi:MAG TPA: hypothetical protein VHW04_14660 [Solirubrobacteraceae bacterium]|nr:hypothetical protein [Solirubrobacteraceae bacterium]
MPPFASTVRPALVDPLAITPGLVDGRRVRRLSILLFVLCVAACFLGDSSASIARAGSDQTSAKAKTHWTYRAMATRLRKQSRSARATRKTRTRRVKHAKATMTSTSSKLHFGIYPWAGAGTVNPADPQVPDDPALALAAVKALKGAHTLTVHLYGQYTGTDSSEADTLLSDAKWWSDNGLRVEMVLRYRPARSELAAGYVPWVQSIATRLAALPGLAALQIGNEPNNTTSAAAGDGAYPGAINAIAHGVPTARKALVAAGRSDVKVGFNWAAGNSPCTTEPMWSQLKAAGGSAFTSSVGWVGIDVYPGTWSAPSQTTFPTASLVNATITDSLRCLRTRHMVTAGLPTSVSITVAETGYPTDADRSEATQAAVLQQTIASVESVRAKYGVTDLRWFSLRDANTASGQLENGYGLLHDDYSPKPAFAAYQEIIAAEGA